MDGAYPMAFSGCLFFTGGLISLIFTTYASFTFSIFIITEVIASFLITVLGMYLLRTSMNKIEDPVAPTTESETEQSSRYSPFYYELEPVIQKRDLPPIPRDIGRDYNRVIVDKV